MTPPNPFVDLAAHPVATLAALGYAMLLSAVSIALAGEGWQMVLWLGNAWDYRTVDRGDYPTWRLAPPRSVYLRLAIVALLVAVEAWLIGGVVYVLTG